MNYYNSIENLPLYNFDKYRNTKDLNWFLVDFDGRQKKIESKELEQVEKTILDEYFKAIDDRSFSNRMQKWAQIESLKLKYSAVKSLLNRIWIGFSDNDMATRHVFISELSKHGFIMPLINTKQGDADEVMRLNSACEGIKTKIHLIENELNKDAKTESVTLSRQLQLVALGLQYSYRLDPKIITVEEWVEMTKLLQEKSKQN